MHEHLSYGTASGQEQQGVEQYEALQFSQPEGLFPKSPESNPDYQGHSHLGSVADKASGVAIVEGCAISTSGAQLRPTPSRAESDLQPQAGHFEARVPAAEIVQRRGIWARLFRRRPAELTPETIMAGLMEYRGYVRTAPRFSELLQDPEGRQNKFTYEYFSKSNPAGEATEYEGLVELRDFLASRGGQSAKDMLENLTFIGRKEYDEGVAGLAAYWKHFLDSDSRAQLCPLALISSSGPLKSDRYLLERILEHFSDEEIQKYKGRLVVNPKLLKASPKRVKVVLLDDWMISGSQISGAYSYSSLMLPDKYHDSRELNFLVASPKRVKAGFSSKEVPIRAYFLAHEATAPVQYSSNNAHISGTHSTVDYDFRDTLDNWGFRPKLARIRRNYGDSRPQYMRVWNAKRPKEDW